MLLAGNKRGTALFVLLLSLVALPAFGGVMLGLREYQRAYQPVVTDFHLDRVEVDGAGDVTISGSFTKRFPAYVCEYEDMQWHAIHENGWMPDVDAEYGDVRKSVKGNNRAKGIQRFYDWKILASEYPQAQGVIGRVHHECLGFWPATTDFDVILITRAFTDETPP